MSDAPNYSDIKEGITARCPRCTRIKGKEETFTGPEEIDQEFGFRRVPAGKNHPKKTRRIPQSYCRKCRAQMSKLARQKKKEEDDA